jgi:hypothetical protein
MSWWQKIGLGIRVVRPAADMGNTAIRIAIFDVNVGEVLLTCLYGTCTVAPAGAANAIQFDLTPTVGTGPSPMDDGVGDLNGLAIGDIIAPQGNITLPAVVAGPLCAGPTFSMPWICKVGDIGITKAQAQAAGTWSFTLFYIPLTDGANVTAA